jgi:hypothetical protein
VIAAAVVSAVIAVLVEVEHVKQIADGRHVARDVIVGIAVVALPA